MGDARVVAVEKALGYSFSDQGILRLALTHRSYTSDVAKGESNERLEFLGDAVLGLVIADELFERFDMPEGAMAKTRAEVVDTGSLAVVARSLGLGEYLLMSAGEDESGGRDKDSILADAMEAVLGAVYLDGGMGAVRSLILDRWEAAIIQRAASPGVGDSKTRLQELLAVEGRVPEYEVEGYGPDHDRWFTATISSEGMVLGSGKGTSKKRAEQAAARAAIDALDSRPDA